MNNSSSLGFQVDELAVVPWQKYIKYDECIGVGAFKHVFKCINVFDGVEYAWNEISLEKLDPVTTSKIFYEIEFYRHLDHYNILRIYDVWFTEARLLVFTTELIVGGSLRDYLRKVHFPLRLSVVQNWSGYILSALSYLHSKYIIHRDLKAYNIYIDYVSNTLKIGDLGLATQKIFTDSDLIVHYQMSMVGTSEFMAPEIYFQHYDERVDIYAFGMCLIELLTKEFPYQECHHTMEIYYKVTQGVMPDALKKVVNPPALALITKCIQKNPNDRPTIYQILADTFFRTDFAAEVASPQSGGQMKPKNSTTFRPVISCSSPFIGQKDQISKKPHLSIITGAKPAPAQAPQASQAPQAPQASAQAVQTAAQTAQNSYNYQTQQNAPFSAQQYTQQPLTAKALQATPSQFPAVHTESPQPSPLHITCGTTRVVDSQRVAEVVIAVADQKLRWPISEKDTPEDALKMLYQYNNELSKGYKDVIYAEFRKICKDLKDGILGEQGL